MGRRGIESFVPADGSKDRILAIAAMITFFLVWELLPRLGLVNPVFTSSPLRIASAARWLFANGFWSDIKVSALEFSLGFGLAMLLGIPVGIELGWNRWLRAAFEPFVVVLNSIPRVALLPLIILWIGIGIESKVAVVFLGAVFPLVINVMAGVRTADETLIKCARSFGAGNRQLLMTIAIPGSVPFMVAGMRIAVGRALVGVFVGELVASMAGVGHMMSIAAATFQTDKLFVGVFVLAFAGFALTEILRRVEKRVESWRSIS
jgi:ABC-type nitrate/sulfonate/bicarbonate transport system permease component